MSENYIVSGPVNHEFLDSLSSVTIGRFLWDKMLSHEPNSIAELCLETNVSHTYKELLIQGQNLACKLKQLGCTTGDIAVLCCGNHIISSPCMLGCFWAGIIIQPLFNKFDQGDYELFFEKSKPRVVIVGLEDYPRLKGACDNKGLNSIFILIDCPENQLPNDDCLSLQEINNKSNQLDPTFQPFDLPKEKLKEVCSIILPSSGTTGHPKGVQHSHSSISFVNDCQDFINKNNYPKNLLTIAGIFWGTGLTNRLWSLGCGFTNYILPKVTVENIFSAVSKFKIEFTLVSSPLLGNMLKSDISQYDLSSLKYILCIGSPISESTLNSARNKFKDTKIFRAYGLTEFIFIHDYLAAYPESIGKLIFQCQAKVISMETGATLPFNSKGELCFKTPSLMMGYLDNPKATADTIDKEGWIHTGDLGYVNDEGYFFIVDRIKSLIKYKGHHVQATEIEEVLLEHPEIFEACVISIPHEIDWEHAKAYVVLMPNSKLTINEIDKYIQERLSQFKWLYGGIEIIEKLPKTASGKVNRNQLKELHLKGLK